MATSLGEEKLKEKFPAKRESEPLFNYLFDDIS